MASLFEQLLQLLRHLLDQFRSTMKLCWGILKVYDTPGTIALLGNERLNRVECGYDIRLSRRHHADNRTENSHVGI